MRDVRTDRTVWQPAPARHEAGSPNVLGAIALAEACDQLAALPAGALAAHEEALRARLVEGLSAIDGVEIARIWPDSAAPVGVLTFTVPDHDPGLVAAYLAAEHGIGVRDGRFCAHPLLAHLGASGGAIRASVGVGTTSEAVDRLVVALTQYLADGPAVRYEVDRRLLGGRRRHPPAPRGPRPGPPGGDRGRRLRPGPGRLTAHRLQGRTDLSIPGRPRTSVPRENGSSR